MPIKKCEYEWYLPILGMAHKNPPQIEPHALFLLMVGCQHRWYSKRSWSHKPDSWVPESLSGVEEPATQENPCWTSTWGRNRLLLHLNSNTLGLISVSYATVLVIFDYSLIYTQTFCALLCTQTSYLYQLPPLDSFALQLLVDFNQQDSPATN